MKYTFVKAFLMPVMLATSCIGALAQDEPYERELNVSAEMRFDYVVDDVDGNGTTSGFHGRYLNFQLRGTITPELSYNWRQRMNKFQQVESDAFAATDWIYLSYRPVHQFSIAGGKQVVLIGGYEYDAAPIDIFFASRFWNNIACYQFGASASYHSDNDKHTITFQVCNSPYQPLSSSCYSYNIYWCGEMGWFRTLWSVNMVEYIKGHYANFIALGNRATFGDFDLQVDLMNRATSHAKFWFADYSLIAKAEYAVTPWMKLMLKGGKDDFHPMLGAPEHQNNPFYGGGFLFYPLKGSKNLCLHAIGDVYHDNDGIKDTQLQIGLKWHIDLYNR